MAEQLEATVIDVFQPKKGEAWGVATVTTGHVSDSVSRQSTRDTISVVGSVGMAKIGETLVATGSWVTHPTHGYQFRADTVAFKPPTKREPLIRFLASTVSGIGETRAAMIVDHFGTDAMHILDERPDLLRTVPGLPHSLVPKMVEAYKVARCTKHRDILLYLQTAGIGPKLSARIVEKYGERAEEVISEDPYVLMTEFAGVGFVTCDKIADQLGIPANDRRRVRAALVHHITEDCEGQGHTHLPTEGLVDRLGDKMRKTRDVETETIRKYLGELLAEGLIIFDDGRLYLASTHRVECAVAERLVEVARLRRSADVGAANDAIARAEASDRVTLTDEQRQAVYEATAGGITVLTGGPGCLRGDTPIHDPVDGTTKTVRERYDDARDFHVLALDTNTGCAVHATALAPRVFQRARMLRLTFSDGQSMVVTPDHRFWDGKGWIASSEVVARLRLASPVLLPSSSDSGR